MPPSNPLPVIPYEQAIYTSHVAAPGGVQEVRRFQDSGIQGSIDAALSGVSARSATVQLEKNPTGLNAAIAANLDGHWSIAAAWRRDDWGDTVATKVKFAW